MKQQHPIDKKAILQSARMTKKYHDETGSIIPKKILGAKNRKDAMSRSERRHYGEQSYDTEYHFYYRSILTGAYKNQIEKQETAIKAAQKRLKQFEEDAAHWKKVFEIYSEKVRIEQQAVDLRIKNLELYKEKVKRVKEQYKTCRKRSDCGRKTKCQK
jgi:hypothetical protein